MLKNFKTYQLSVQFYRLCEQTRVPSHLRDQLLRASSSIVLNIAEGAGKTTPKEQARFYGISLGSLRECEAILHIGSQPIAARDNLASQLGACLYTLAKKKAAA